MSNTNGKNSDMMGDPMLVVAGALKGKNGRWLMHRRPSHKHHGDLWEFPGGKLETAESPSFALIRELKEELGISVAEADCVPAGFAHEEAKAGRPAIVILLYTLADWDGEPAALEGGEVGWFTPEEIAQLDRPPLDLALCGHLFSKA